MSRIGKAPIAIPAGVKVTVDEKTNVVTVEGKNGKLSQAVHPDLKVTVEDNHVYVPATTANTVRSTASSAPLSTTWWKAYTSPIAKKWNSWA